MANDILVMVKVAERCNINCSYCYMYNGVDQSWQSRPKFLSDQWLDCLTRNLVQHKEMYPSARMTLEIHGGEPLLLGKERMRRFFSNLRRDLPEEALLICTQTNGILLDREWLDLFFEMSATVSISCDGPPDVHNEHRRGFTGKATSDLVEKAIVMCVQHPEADRIFSGVLSVAEPNYDGAAVVDYFYDLGVPNFDFLLPDANYAAPPRHITNYDHDKMLHFLTCGFDRWIAIGRKDFKIRVFETFIRGIFGQRSELDAFGGDLSPIAVVESDGSYRLLDVLAICEEHIAQTPMHVSRNTLKDFLSYTEKRYPPACDKCLRCPAFTACGGGYLAHRFDGTSYDNPSYYCYVLLGLYKYIKDYVLSVTPSNIWVEAADVQNMMTTT